MSVKVFPQGYNILWTVKVLFNLRSLPIYCIISEIFIVKVLNTIFVPWYLYISILGTDFEFKNPNPLIHCHSEGIDQAVSGLYTQSFLSLLLPSVFSIFMSKSSPRCLVQGIMIPHALPFWRVIFLIRNFPHSVWCSVDPRKLHPLSHFPLPFLTLDSNLLQSYTVLWEKFYFHLCIANFRKSQPFLAPVIMLTADCLVGTVEWWLGMGKKERLLCDISEVYIFLCTRYWF